MSKRTVAVTGGGSGIGRAIALAFADAGHPVHVGDISQARVEDTVVYVTMGGGCQGCAVSAMTLRDGIARSIREAIPEVTDVVDTTDHDAGENPYYT